MMIAARIGDDHECQIHANGPIRPPCCRTVFIGGKNAARATDKASCCGMPLELLKLPNYQRAANVIKANSVYIIAAAHKYHIDPTCLAATIFMEHALNVKEDELDNEKNQLIIWDNQSIGVVQMQPGTARFLEGEEVHLIDPSEDAERRKSLLYNNERAILYAAAYLAYFQNEWRDRFPMMSERCDILATLYNIGHETIDGNKREPHDKPLPNYFGSDAAECQGAMAALLALSRCSGSGPIDTINSGSSTVFSEGLGAARKDDTTIHSGKILEGWSTVFIGGGTTWTSSRRYRYYAGNDKDPHIDEASPPTIDQLSDDPYIQQELKDAHLVGPEAPCNEPRKQGGWLIWNHYTGLVEVHRVSPGTDLCQPPPADEYYQHHPVVGIFYTD